MSEPVFRGIATALITPFGPDGIDYTAYGRIIDWQIEEGINALVVGATTGEGVTLDDDERCALITFAVQRAAGRVPIIASTGTNDTAHAIRLTRFACQTGADALLVVTPYYNKATQAGLVASFEAIANESAKPILLYNVPSRTGCNIQPTTYERLAQHPRICGIKEANGDISSVVTTRSLVGDRLAIYSGNDDQIVPILSMGGLGCISVLSNVLPRQTCEICERFFAGDVAGAAALQCQYLPLIHALFSEVNPIPVKAAMSALGWCEDRLRLPLTPMEPAHRAILLDVMRAQGLSV